MVQVEKVDGLGVGQSQLPRPGLDLKLVGLVVERGQDRILGTGAILIGAVHRRGPGRAFEPKRVVTAQSGREVDRAQIEPLVEACRQGVLAEIGTRSGQQGHLEAVVLELLRKRPADVR